MSPAVPDPPNVFEFLDNESVVDAPILQEDEVGSDDGPNPEDEEGGVEEIEGGGQEQAEGEVEERDEDEEDEDEENEEEQSRWPPNESESSSYQPVPPSHLATEVVSGSSASSSFHGSDHFSDRTPDNDTDRSTSPERSVKEQSSDREEEADPQPEPPVDRAFAKIASQMAAAQQRQNLYGSMHSFGTHNLQRGSAVPPRLSSMALSPRHAHQVQQRPLPRVEKPPVTGYELLASRLSSHSSGTDENGIIIKPIYRKFGALNHRLLLHLQDELSELEEQLHNLDTADTQHRRAGAGGAVVPASRRAAAMQGGELQWRKTDVLGRIGFKLAQYSKPLSLRVFSFPILPIADTPKDQALSSFNTTQNLSSPDPNDIDAYRSYLQTENPIAEAETHFLDPADDLVSICSDSPPHPPPSNSLTGSTTSSQLLSRSASQISSQSSSALLFQASSSSPPLPSTTPTITIHTSLPALAISIAVSVLIPILTFSVIPGFIGRMTVVGLVAGGVLGGLIQAGAIGPASFGREAMVCGGVYMGAMVVIAGIMA
jgi:hypothetical protein